jgi:hypothetical protein
LIEVHASAFQRMAGYAQSYVRVVADSSPRKNGSTNRNNGHAESER